MIDFYNGGGVDVACLGMAEVMATLCLEQIRLQPDMCLALLCVLCNADDAVVACLGMAEVTSASCLSVHAALEVASDLHHGGLLHHCWF